LVINLHLERNWHLQTAPCKVDFKHIWPTCWTQRPVRLMRLREACLRFTPCDFKNQLAPSIDCKTKLTGCARVSTSKSSACRMS
jgi:hypothetical protein